MLLVRSVLQILCCRRHFCWEALVDGVFNKEDLRDLVMESLKLLWSLVKMVASLTCSPCEMAMKIVDFVAELYSGWPTLNVCADVISSIAFDVISYFNNLGVQYTIICVQTRDRNNNYRFPRPGYFSC